MTTKTRKIAPEETVKENRVWHFWKGRPAPSIQYSFNPFLKKNVILREQPAAPPPSLTLKFRNQYVVAGPIQISPSRKSAKEIAKLWNEQYRIGDWSMHISELEVMEILHNPGTIVLGIVSPAGDIVGTILSTRLNGICLVGEKECELRMVEGLVLHPHVRGQGAAGWLIGWLDHITSMTHPTTHVWFRETCKQQQSVLPKSIVLPAATEHVAQTTLAKLTGSILLGEATPIAWSAVSPILHALWDSYSIVFQPDKEPSNIQWWRSDIPGFPTSAILVGIAKTRRVKAGQHLHIVVFSCFVRIREECPDVMKDPFWNNPEEPMCDMIREGIEAAAIAQQCDILQVYSPSFSSGWNKRSWSILEKQKRKMYMYNRIPPSMGYSSFLFPRCGV